jgi:hypothetical protein
MTYREKLEIEYPDCIDEACDGGCSSCPHEYDYCKKGDTLCAEEPLAKVKPNEEKCRKCWDQVIPGTEEKMMDNIFIESLSDEIVDDIFEYAASKLPDVDGVALTDVLCYTIRKTAGFAAKIVDRAMKGETE